VPYATAPIGPDGAVIEVLVGVSWPRRDNLLRMGLPLPTRGRVRVQIDTGASFSAIDAAILATLGIGPTDVRDVMTPSVTGTPTPFRFFPVSLGMENGGIEMFVGDVEVMECVFSPVENVRGLLGRDVLQHCLFVYDGQHKTFSIAY
jgi:hypothetical protein